MKKLLSILLALVLLAGLALPAASTESSEPESWPILIISAAHGFRMTIGDETWEATSATLRVEPGTQITLAANHPAASMTAQFSHWQLTGVVIEEYDWTIITFEMPETDLVVTTVYLYLPSGNPSPWWACLPTFLQLILRWVFFGWLWM